MLNARDELTEILGQYGYTLADIECASIEVLSAGACAYHHVLAAHRTEIDERAWLKLLDFRYADNVTGLSLKGFVWMRDGSWFDRSCMGHATFWTHRKRPAIPTICKL